MNIVKAEILFSRKCNLSCAYCGMVTNKENTLSIEQWYHGLDNLKKAGCSFAAFYGAEPMLEYNKLKHVVAYAEYIGIHTTVITSGSRIPEFRKKVRTMVEMGAKSFSMSYTMNAFCSSTKLKREEAFQHLKYIGSLRGIRDVAAITTVTSDNYHLLPAMITKMSAANIWTFFDFLHMDRGMPGTKCRGNKSTLLIQKKDIYPLLEVMETISTMKRDGYLVHTNEPFIEKLKENLLSGQSIYNWYCTESDMFPSWVTIDCDGSILPCDDFNVMENPPKFHEHAVERWDDLFDVFKRQINYEGCHCCWNTHIDAHAVKAGIIPITNYIHGDING